LAGVLNSSLTALLTELHGRFYGGGVLELEIYECENLPVLNPKELTTKEKQRIEVAFSRVCDAQRNENEKLEQKARIELDNAVFDVLGLSEDERKQVYEGLESLRRMRLSRKKVDIFVKIAEKWKPHKKKEKRPRTEPSKKLDTWIKS